MRSSRAVPACVLLALTCAAVVTPSPESSSKRVLPTRDLLRYLMLTIAKPPELGGMYSSSLTGGTWHNIPYRPVRRLGSEFLGKRSATPVISDTFESNAEDEEQLSEKRSMGSEFLGKRLGSEFLGKREMGSQFIGKRGMGSEFLGKRGMGSEFLGKRGMGSEFLGKRGMGSEFLGKRGMGSEFLGKRGMGSEFLGKRGMGSEFLGKRGMGSEYFGGEFNAQRLGNIRAGSDFLGKRYMGSEFLGKRSVETTQNVDDLLDEDVDKRGMGSEFLGKRSVAADDSGQNFEPVKVLQRVNDYELPGKKQGQQQQGNDGIPRQEKPGTAQVRRAELGVLGHEGGDSDQMAPQR